MLFIYDIFGNLIGEFDIDGNPINTYVYLGNHRLAKIGGVASGGGGCSLSHNVLQGAKTNWVVILVVPVIILLGIRYRRNRYLVGLFVLIGASAIIIKVMNEAKSTISYSEGIFYYHNDHLGTPQVMTDEDGVVVWDAAYEPFGKINSYATQSITNRFRFPGQYEDDMTGMYYNHHRYYMPQVGRYNRTDPIRSNIYNLYNYTENNPIIYLDLNGLARYSGSCVYLSGGNLLGGGIMRCEVTGTCGPDNLKQKGNFWIFMSGATVGLIPVGLTGFTLLQEDDLYGRGDLINLGGSASIVGLSGSYLLGEYIGTLWLGGTRSIGQLGSVGWGLQAGVDISGDIFLGISLPTNIRTECCNWR